MAALHANFSERTALGFAAVRDQQGSTSSVINADDVIRSAEPTVVNALSGKASGVRITKSNKLIFQSKCSRESVFTLNL